MGVELDAQTAPAGLLAGEERRATPGKGIEHNAAALRAIEDSVTDQRLRFDRRMHSQRVVAVLTEAAGAWIIPDVGSVAAKTT